MADDREVLREVWQGRIPTAFTLYQDNVQVLSQPDPYYLMLPRLSYISVVTEKVRKYFSRFLSEGSGEEGEANSTSDMWFDYQGTPLKWHLPVGVLYDQICVLSSETEPVLPPWNLTVHFGNFPQSEILKCDTKDFIESHFMSCIKEADQIKHGGRIVSTMQKKDHNQLWQGLHNDKFDQFWAVNRRLMDTKGEDSLFKHIPFRLYESDKPLQQRLIKPNVKVTNATTGVITTGPTSSSGSSDHDSNPVSSTASSSGASAAGSSVVGGGSTEPETAKRLTTLRDLLEEMVPNKPYDEVKVITQGISPELDTPLQWMSEHLSYPDNFLHICVR